MDMHTWLGQNIGGRYGNYIDGEWEQAGPDAFLVIETRTKVEASSRVVATDNGVNVEVAITGPAWNYGRWAASDDRPGYQPTAPPSPIQR